MNKYLVKPTKIIDERGFVYSADTLDETSGFNDLKKKIDELNTESILALQDRVYNLETVNGAVNDRIEAAEEVSNEAKTTANAAHSIASGLQEAVGNAESTAVKAQEKALEAYNSLHSLNADFENLNSRLKDLEDTDGEASVPIVGKSKMGYVSDFTGYVEGGSYYVQASWKDESRSLQFGAESNLGDVLEELMYVTASGISEMHNRVSALESNSGGSTAHGNCLENQVSIRQFYMVDKNDFIADGVPEEEIPALREQTINMPAAEGIENAYALAKSVKTKINVNVLPRLEALESGSGGSSSSGTCNCSCNITDYTTTVMESASDMYGYLDYTQPSATTGNNLTDILDQLQSNIEVNKDVIQNHMSKIKSNEEKITALNSTVAGHTSSIQSLDTRTGSHTASIGQLENRMTDVELQTTTNKNKIAALEASSGSGGSITHIGDLNIKSNGGTLRFVNRETHDVYDFKTLNEVLEVILPIIEDLIERLYTLEYEFYTTEH